VLHETFTWREGSGTSNHDINYVYSADGGNTWKNNAGTIISDRDSGTPAPAQWSLNSAGLVVQPLSMNTSLMNQQTQNVDSDGKIHTMMWHLDTAKAPTCPGTWDATISSYFQYWRDDLGNWHRNKLPGDVNTRPKIYFDENDTAIAIYNLGGSTIHSGGTLVIAAATKASNWTDWKIIRTDTGPYFSEAQADPELIKTNGILSVVMQNTPTSSTQATSIHSLDYTLSLTPATQKTFISASGDWDASGNWSSSGMPNGNNIAFINSNRTARIALAVSNVDDSVVIGSGGSNGTLNVVNGGALTVGGTISVGRDGGAVGTYNQSGGNVSSWRFVVGDYYNETSGGGVSSATVSGGTLTTGELQVATSANGSSSGSTFTVAGGNVTVNGEVIMADCGNTGTVNLTAGNLTVAGDLHEGFNQTNNSTLSFNGGSLDMTGNAISVDTIALNSGLLSNVSAINNGATITKNSAGTMRLAGNNTFANPIQIQAGALRAESSQALGSAGGNTTISGGNDTGRLELTGNINLAESFILNGRQPTGAATNAPAILNVSGNNTITGTIGTDISGDQYNIQSDSGQLTIRGNFQNNQSGTPGNVRYLKLMGNGDGKWSGTIGDNNSTTNPSKTALTKMGAGTWTLSGSNTYTGQTTINGGTLRIVAAGVQQPVAGAILQLDASNASTIIKDADGTISRWNDAAGSGTYAFQNTDSAQPVYTLNQLNGKAIVDLGTYHTDASGMWMNFSTQLTDIRSAFWVLKGYSHFLCDDNSSDFHRGGFRTSPSDLIWSSTYASPNVYNGATYLNGTQVNGSTTNLPADYSMIDVITLANTQASRLCNDRIYGRTGGQQIAEILLYDRPLSDEERQQVEAYLRYKWFGIGEVSAARDILPTGTAVNITSSGATLDLNGVNQTIGSLAGVSGSRVLMGAAGGNTFTVGGDNSSTDFAGTIEGGGSLLKSGTGAFTLSGSNSYTGSTTIDGGTLALANGGSLASSSSILTGSSGTFLVGAGAFSVAGIDGSGATTLTDNAVLTTGYVSQNELTLGAGAELIITPIPGGPQALNARTNPVPEPPCVVLLLLAVLAAGSMRYVIGKRTNLQKIELPNKKSHP
jgi:autotransporter-associated beta strand protein